MKTVLITGCSGFLASRVAARLRREGFSVLAPGHSALDVADAGSCRRYFEENRPDAIVHLAAISDISACEQNPDLSRAVNAKGPVNLAAAASEAGFSGSFLFASSDQVYTANHSPDRLNRETDPLAPENLYAREKLAAEEGVLAILPGAIALRLPWMFDLQPGKPDFIKNLAVAVRGGTPLRFAANELRGMTYSGEIAENILRLLAQGTALPGGPCNFGSPASGNSYETGRRALRLTAKAMGRDEDAAEALAQSFLREEPRSLAMDQERAESLGLSFGDTLSSVALCLEREAGREG